MEPQYSNEKIHASCVSIVYYSISYVFGVVYMQPEANYIIYRLCEVRNDVIGLPVTVKNL